MPFTIACPNCDARLQAPDTVEGKRVKCKKCGEAFVARPLDEDDDRPARPAAKPRPRPVPDDEDDRPARRPVKASWRAEDDDEDRSPRRRRDEYEDEDEPRPRAKKKGKKKAAGPPVLLFVLLGVGALLVLIGGGVGAYFYFSGDKKPDNPPAKGGPGPGGPGAPVGGGTALVGWVDFAEPGGRYRVKLPQRPRAPITQRQQLPNGQQTEIRMHPAESAGEAFMIGHVAMPAAAAGAPADAILDGAIDGGQLRSKGAALRSKTPITYQGFPGREAVLEFPGKKGSLVMRVILANDRLIMLIAAGDTVTANAPKVRGFFESLKIE